MQALLGRRYRELAEDECVLPPLRPTDMLRPEHFATPLPELRYPVRLDFTSDRFRLRSLGLLVTQLSETALQELPSLVPLHSGDRKAVIRDVQVLPLGLGMLPHQGPEVGLPM